MCSRQSARSPATDGRPSDRAGVVLLLVAGAASLVAAQDSAPAAGAAIDVGHYDVALSLDVGAGSITGKERIDLGIREATRWLVFDSGALLVDSVSSGAALPFTQRARRLIVTLPAEARAGERRRLDITYHGVPKNGLTLLAESAQAYTTFSTSQWMVAVDAPADRATLDLELGMPAGWKAAGTGRRTGRAERDGQTVYRWHQDRQMPSYTFGFVAGSFTEATERHRGIALTYLGAPFPATDLRRIFRDTPAMLDFFEERSGVRYPGDGYVQALVPVSGGQELAGLAHMSEAYGRSVLADATATSLIAHELAHQWWGNLVTNRDWTHFWLNEGLATFMAAAYKERARGRDAYLADVEAWRTRVERLRAAGTDKALVFPDWNRPTADDRAVVYQKGALVLHELREQLGDAAFWTGLRSYTRRQAGQSVTSTDLQHAFETSSGRDLGPFFNERVYGR
jgi:aminopeptidase N